MSNWMEAHNNTDVHIAKISGLLAMLQEVAGDFPGLANPDPLANGILFTISTIAEDMDKLIALRETEWRSKTAQA